MKFYWTHTHTYLYPAPKTLPLMSVFELCVWLLLPNIMSIEIFHFIVYGYRPFFPITVRYFIFFSQCSFLNLSIQLLMKCGQFPICGLSQIVCPKRVLWKYLCSSVRCMPKNWISGSQGMHTFSFNDSAKQFSKVLYQSILLPAANESSVYSSLVNSWCILSFSFGALYIVVIVPHCGLTGTSLIINAVFTCVLAT